MSVKHTSHTSNGRDTFSLVGALLLTVNLSLWFLNIDNQFASIQEMHKWKPVKEINKVRLTSYT